jgi:hypothetical protein
MISAGQLAEVQLDLCLRRPVVLAAGPGAARGDALIELRERTREFDTLVLPLGSCAVPVPGQLLPMEGV